MKNKTARLRPLPDVAVHPGEVLHRVRALAATGTWRYAFAGAGTVFDLAGSSLRTPKLESVADDAAKIKNDFRAIGNDLRDVLARLG